jgi:aminopeptidase N
VYYKPSVGFDYLQTMMGDTLFDRCMHRYYDEWKFRHPQPADFQRSFEEASGQDLDWFFNRWLSASKKADYTICSLKPRNRSRLEHPFEE